MGGLVYAYLIAAKSLTAAGAILEMVILMLTGVSLIFSGERFLHRVWWTRRVVITASLLAIISYFYIVLWYPGSQLFRAASGVGISGALYLLLLLFILVGFQTRRVKEWLSSRSS